MYAERKKLSEERCPFSSGVSGLIYRAISIIVRLVSHGGKGLTIAFISSLKEYRNVSLSVKGKSHNASPRPAKSSKKKIQKIKNYCHDRLCERGV